MWSIKSGANSEFRLYSRRFQPQRNLSRTVSPSFRPESRTATISYTLRNLPLVAPRGVVSASPPLRAIWIRIFFISTVLIFVAAAAACRAASASLYGYTSHQCHSDFGVKSEWALRRCPGIVRESIRKRAHTERVRERSATVVSAC